MIEYYINGVLFKDLKIFVKESIGLIEPPTLRKVELVNWADYHGAYADLENRTFEPKKITLKCFVTGSNWTDLYYNYNAFLSLFQQNGLQELILNVPFGLDSKHYAKVSARPLPFYVYLSRQTDLSKRIKDSEVLGEFDIELIEPQPMKRIFQAKSSSVNYTNEKQKFPVTYYTQEKTRELPTGSAENISIVGKFKLITFIGEPEDLENITLTNSTELWKAL